MSSNGMNTAFLLMAQYNGAAVIPVDLVCRDYFPHLTTEKFVRKALAGEIDLPIVRLEKSQKSARGVPLADLAAYLDKQIEQSRKERDKMRSALIELQRHAIAS
jgi:Pyocin activator protein PrtN